MAEKKKYYNELNIYRGLVIVWVVIGHSFNAEESFLGFLHNYAYSFHMSAFFMLSGFLFNSKLKRSKDIKSKLSVIGNRFQRLIIPYLVYTAISYVLKAFLEEYANNSLGSNIFVDTLLCRDNPNGGIWFLYALFLISVFMILLSNLPIWSLFAISVGLKVVACFVSSGIPPIDFLISNSVFFAGGALIADYYEPVINKFTQIVNDRKKYSALAVITIVLLAVSFVATYFCVYKTDSTVLKLVIRLFNIIVWYLVAMLCTKIHVLEKANMLFGNYGMDIYMIGYYVQITLRVVLKSILGAPYLLYSIVMMICGLLLPIPISKLIVRKFKITRMLFLGDFSKKDK